MKDSAVQKSGNRKSGTQNVISRRVYSALFETFSRNVHTTCTWKDEGKANEMTFWLGNVRRNIQRQANAIR